MWLRRLGCYHDVGAILCSSECNGFANAPAGPSDKEGPSCEESDWKNIYIKWLISSSIYDQLGSECKLRRALTQYSSVHDIK